jgi:hypothetical protein
MNICAIINSERTCAKAALINYLDIPEKKKKQHEMGDQFACQIQNERGIELPHTNLLLHAPCKRNVATHLLKVITSKAKVVVAPGQRKKKTSTNI